MHCILTASPRGRDSWHLLRSAEVIGYHAAETSVRILISIIAENRLDSNSLLVMHRGDVKCHIVEPWPAPLHSDERRFEGATRCVLDRLYGEVFEEVEGKLFAKDGLLSDASDVRIRTWGPNEAQGCDHERGNLVGPMSTAPCPMLPVPFTCWTLGPFEEPGLYIIALALEFSGATYRRLVQQKGGFFSVDGPERLLSVTRRTDLADLRRSDPDTAEEWAGLLGPFADDRKICSDSYDIIVLAPPLADQVVEPRELCRQWVYEAPNHLKDIPAKRYTTGDQWFTIGFRYETAPAESGIPATVDAV